MLNPQIKCSGFNCICLKKTKQLRLILLKLFYIYIYSFSRRFYTKRLTIEEYNKRYNIKRLTDTGSASNSYFQALFRASSSQTVKGKRAKLRKVFFKMRSNDVGRDDFSGVA